MPPPRPSSRRSSRRPAPAALAAAPAGAGRLLPGPQGLLLETNVVVGTSWWRVRMTPVGVLDWEAAHLPARFESASGDHGPWDSAGPAGGLAVSSGTWSLSPVYGVLPQRSLLVAAAPAAPAADGQAVIRVDSGVTWLDRQPPSERLPVAATVVTFSAVRGGSPLAPAPPAAFTVTDPAQVRHIAALIGTLPVYPISFFSSCPNDTGQELVLTFRAAAGGPALAVATVRIGGCPDVSLSIGGRTLPPLDEASTLAREALSDAGLRWPGYDQAAPGPGESPGPVLVTPMATP